MKLHSLLAGVPLMGDLYAQDLEIASISYDTRTLRPGALFIALPGAKTDGHKHISEALEKGAAAVLCREAPPEPGPWLVTEDTRLALALASANWFRHPGREMTLIGVTGTNGKTTTTCLIKSMLEQAAGAKVGLIGTIQNMIGEQVLPAHRTTPESYELQELLRTMSDAGCTHVVMEASSHALVQHRTAGLEFDAGVFTNLTQDHLDYHKTMEAYREAKERLFDQSEIAVFNLDDEAGRWYAQRRTGPMFTYSEIRAKADLTARNLQLLPDRVSFEALISGELRRAELPIPGGFSIYNALAALACGLALGLSLKSCTAALAQAKGVKGRVEVVPSPAPYTVILDYAHTPDALENILHACRGFAQNRLICLFGCGGDRDRSKRPIMGAVAAELADLVVLTSDNPRTEDPEAILSEILPGLAGWDAPYHVEPDRVKAIHWALDQARAGDVVLLAGKGHETYQEVMGEQRHLDEREVIAEYFAENPGILPVGMI